MLKDITIGQFFPGNSIVHRMDPRFKIIIAALIITMLFCAQDIYGLLISVVFVIGAFVVSGTPFKMMLKGLKPVIPIVIITSILNLFFIEGNIVFKLGFIKITDNAIETSLFMIIRIIFLIAGTSLLTYTTSPIVLTDAIERLMGPLKKIKMPVHELAMMMTIALRFIPTLIEETDQIMAAQKA